METSMIDLCWKSRLWWLDFKRESVLIVSFITSPAGQGKKDTILYVVMKKWKQLQLILDNSKSEGRLGDY